MSLFTRVMTLVFISALRGRVQTGRIIGGREAKAHSRPYMVYLTQVNDSGEVGHCGGFLVTKEFVMTAAHCKADSYRVSLGIHNVKSDKGQTRSVKSSFPHPNFTTQNSKVSNDIMLLKLSAPVELNKNVDIIELAEQGEKSLPHSCSVCGWGMTEEGNKTGSDVLKEIGFEQTKEVTYRGKDMYCSEGETGAAPGDSGGPLVCNDRAYGVASHVFNKTNKDNKQNKDFHCFTKIPDYRDWAEKIMCCK